MIIPPLSRGVMHGGASVSKVSAGDRVEFLRFDRLVPTDYNSCSFYYGNINHLSLKLKSALPIFDGLFVCRYQSLRPVYLLARRTKLLVENADLVGVYGTRTQNAKLA